MSAQCEILDRPAIRLSNNSPIAELLINNFLIKTIEYYKADCSVFVFARKDDKDMCFMTLCGRFPMSASQFTVLQGVFSLHFSCLFDDEAHSRETAVKQFCMNGGGVVIPAFVDSLRDYEYLSLYENRGIYALAGVGSFIRPLHTSDKDNEYDRTQFLQTFGTAVLKHL